MKMGKIINIGETEQGGAHRTPKQALERALGKLGDSEEGAFEKGSKLLVVVLDDVSESYDIGWVQCGLTYLEAVALLDVAKSAMKRDMGY
jgi:hypothetical protein